MAVLSEQRTGDVVVVSGIVGDVDGTVLRLFEMGLTRGAQVTVTRRAPLGDPMEIAVRGTRLCLRRNDAARFVVVVADDAPRSTL